MLTFMRGYGIGLLRISLGTVFVWFGLLKVIGRSPVERLVAATVYWVAPDIFVPLLGAWEMLIGLGLLFGMAVRLTSLLFWLQLAGTLMVLPLLPHVAFQGGNPLLLTMEGEFVINNLVLLSAGLAVGSHVRRLGPEM